MLRITLQGMADVEKQMKRIERGAAAMGRYQAVVGSKLPYAWGMEFGRHRLTGKLARKAGGAFYITRAVNQVMSEGDRDISEGLNKVMAPGAWVLRRLGLWARRLARQNAPRGGAKKASYRLWRSIKHEVRRQ